MIPKKLYQLGREFPTPFACVPWGHHIAIISKCKSVDEALFYIGKTIEQEMSRAALANCIKANLYEHLLTELKIEIAYIAPTSDR